MKARVLTTIAMFTVLSVAAGCTPRWPTGTGGHRRTHYYVALGDSLSIGAQPEGDTDRGYTNVLHAQLRQQDPDLALVEMGCGGETATSMIHGDLPGIGSCGPPQFYDAVYPQKTQLATAVRFLREHRRDVSLVTIDIGGNDIRNAGCDVNPDPACPTAARDALRKDLEHIMFELRAAAPRTHIVGMTYYNPYLAQWLLGPAGQAQALGSVSGSEALNSMLRDTYHAFGAGVAEVGRAFSTTDFTTLVDLARFSAVPLAVARLCQWTWMCAPAPAGPDVHANDQGYAVIAQAFADVIGTN